MGRSSLLSAYITSYCSVSFLSLFAHNVHASKYHDHPDSLFTFFSRPDIRAPKWNITTYHADLTSPGYWFLAAYETITSHDEFNGYGWIGPHIYDARDGELVWSGTSEFDGANGMDFGVNNVLGKTMLTLTDRDQGTGIIMDERFDIRRVVQMEDNRGQINGHEFHFVDNGTRILIVKNQRKAATPEASKNIGYHGSGGCVTNFNTFTELDASTFEQTFFFDSYEHIDLEESTWISGGPKHFCLGGGLGYDYLHMNSVDKNEDGDYILSGRHTNTLYKISGKNGTVLWRLEGYRGKSDFEMINLNFSRQHDVRWRGRNETHRFISFVDNAKGDDKEQKPSYAYSRGLVVALDEENMVATLERHFDHPSGNYTHKRGSMQYLPNGNVFMGWGDQAHLSEHTLDGNLIMEGFLQPEWLGSYRNYKFPFVGRPATLPAVHSAAFGADNNTVQTQVSVSWNGATEVRSWKLYRSTSAGKQGELVVSTDRTGFETRLEYYGYASYVYVEALDGQGSVLATTELHKTITHPNVTAEAIEQEQRWLEQAHADLPPAILQSPLSMFCIGLASGMVVLAAVWLTVAQGPVMLRKSRATRYEPVVEGKFDLVEDEGEETLVAEHSGFYDQDDELEKGKVREIARAPDERQKLLDGDTNVP